MVAWTQRIRTEVGSAVAAVVHPGEKLDHLAAYEAACAAGEGGAYLRERGVVLLADHRVAQAPRRRCAGREEARRDGRPAVGGAGRDRPADAGSWTGPSARLAKTETALTIMGKAHALLEEISESADADDRRGQALMAAYDELDRAPG